MGRYVLRFPNPGLPVLPKLVTVVHTSRYTILTLFVIYFQAWVVFEDVAAATNAVKQLNEFPFYDKPMRVSYATSKSDASAKRDGTFDSAKRDPMIRQKRKAESQVSEKKSQAAKKEAGVQKNAAAAANDAPPNEILFVEGLPGKRAATSSFGVLVRRGFKSRTSPTFFFLNNPTPRRCRPMITSHNR